MVQLYQQFCASDVMIKLYVQPKQLVSMTFGFNDGTWNVCQMIVSLCLHVCVSAISLALNYSDKMYIIFVWIAMLLTFKHYTKRHTYSTYITSVQVHPRSNWSRSQTQTKWLLLFAVWFALWLILSSWLFWSAHITCIKHIIFNHGINVLNCQIAEMQTKRVLLHQTCKKVAQFLQGHLR